MSMVAMLSCGMVDYDSPTLSKDEQKKIRRAVRQELTPLGIDLVCMRRKIKPARTHACNRPQSGWISDGFHAVGLEHPTGQAPKYSNLNALCRDVVTLRLTPVGN